MKHYFKRSDIERLKLEKSPGKIFIPLILGLFGFIILITLVLKPLYYSYIIVILGILSIPSTYFIYWAINKSVIKDINQQRLQVVTTILKDKKVITDYEPGSASLGGEMRGFPKHTFYLANGAELLVDKATYLRFEKGDKIDILYSENAKIFLRVEKSTK